MRLVRFKCSSYELGSSISKEALAASMGICVAELVAYHDRLIGKADRLEITCRPDQFAMFLIHRNQNGGSNSFKALEPVLVDNTDGGLSIDVSERYKGPLVDELERLKIKTGEKRKSCKKK